VTYCIAGTECHAVAAVAEVAAPVVEAVAVDLGIAVWVKIEPQI